MRLVCKAVRWVVSVFMVLLLVVGAIDLIGMRMDRNLWSGGGQDLQWVGVTITASEVTPLGLTLTTGEYRTFFTIPVTPVPAELAAALHEGSQLKILVRRGADWFNMLPVYEVNDLDGKTLINLTSKIVPVDWASVQALEKIFFVMIDLPVAYFLCIALLPYIRRSRKGFANPRHVSGRASLSRS